MTGGAWPFDHILDLTSSLGRISFGGGGADVRQSASACMWQLQQHGPCAPPRNARRGAQLLRAARERRVSCCAEPAWSAAPRIARQLRRRCSRALAPARPSPPRPPSLLSPRVDSSGVASSVATSFKVLRACRSVKELGFWKQAKLGIPVEPDQ